MRRKTACRAAVRSTEAEQKKALKRVRNISAPKKISGTVLLSHSRIYSTIAAGVLNYRVREGNVCCYPAMSTGKKHNKEKVSRKNPEEMRRTQY